MRIIGGKFKGKKLLEPQDKETRPLKDLTKESIFNIINHSNKFSIDIKKAKVLDLFSGVGSFGIECISQGASHVTFIEKYKAVLPILKKNLNNLKSEINCEIIDISDLKNIVENIYALYPAVGENFDFIQNNNLKNIKFLYRKLDQFSWQYCNKGFFNFKNYIPKIIAKFN